MADRRLTVCCRMECPEVDLAVHAVVAAAGHARPISVCPIGGGTPRPTTYPCWEI